MYHIQCESWGFKEIFLDTKTTMLCFDVLWRQYKISWSVYAQKLRNTFQARINLRNMLRFTHTYPYTLPPIVLYQPDSTSALLRLNGDSYQANPIFKHIEDMFIHTNIFSIFESWMSWCCFKKMAPFKHGKTDALVTSFSWSGTFFNILKI